mmetsp:Transcript_52642/g.115427  ORF Transcript_52642/g.115427 Transcript_52642/m.115427 type:complete len:255 (+) Transcript_52642:42-806(+)|eukprot:CAMPEP_0204273164 /NCGR_PEP_ID=MMETSP0468-20130131/22731_1 /ASSEMBLY_ACC=CAM_ASM_000383 /TAXON_ID=2969 /ORGANISM="Oxyrrhis marina" /LENGTH=254 /DNA_ID=CAMNT_0051249129 /DNA_START=40 /DNA_END=804 /DNA_ORIENTATION=+
MAVVATPCEIPPPASLPPVPTQFGAADTLLLVDYDDTLLPTSYLRSLQLLPQSTEPWDGPGDLCQSVRTVLQSLDTEAARLLRLLKKNGNLILITNGVEGWIERTAPHFLPETWVEIQKVQHYSARHKHSGESDCPFYWKEKAYFDEIRTHSYGRHTYMNIVSIGDSPVEREALVRSSTRFANAIPKSVKLAEQPQPGVLQQELGTLVAHLSTLVGFVGPLDLQLGGLATTPPPTPPGERARGRRNRNGRRRLA